MSYDAQGCASVAKHRDVRERPFTWGWARTDRPLGDRSRSECGARMCGADEPLSGGRCTRMYECRENTWMCVATPCEQLPNKKPLPKSDRGLELKPGSVLLSHGETPHYHRRWAVSLPSSVWDRVVPTRHCCQANCLKNLNCFKYLRIRKVMLQSVEYVESVLFQSIWVLYGQASRAISTG